MAELDDPGFAGNELRSLRTGIMAGSPCPIETMERVVAQMHMREVSVANGVTETRPVSFRSALGDPLERRVSAGGRIRPRLEAKPIDGDGNMVPLGQTGELCVRGDSVLRGDWGDEARRREVIHDAWMHSGELTVIDEQGDCSIVGRAKDMPIRGGEHAHAREIEAYDEQVCAWIVLKPGQQCTTEQIRDFCGDPIAPCKVPRYLGFVAEMPMAITGKAHEFVMCEQMIDELGLAQARAA